MNVERLRPSLSLFDISTLSSASMGPAYSLASTMGPMVVAVGSAAPLALIIISLAMACIASSYGALSARMPHAGSSYGWVLHAFGPRVGAYTAWILLLATSFATLATAIPAGTYTLDLIAPQLADSTLAVSIVSALWVVISGILLAAGMRPTANVTAWLLFAEVIVLGGSAAVAALSPAGLPPPVTHTGGVPIAFGAFASAMVLSIWMVDGWELSAATSEEGRSAQVAGNGGIFALIGISVMVLLCMLAYLHLLGPAGFAGREADAMTLVGSHLGGAWRPLIVITVLVSTSASLWTTMLYLTRSLYAMGRDHMVAHRFAALNAAGSPQYALIVVTVVAALMTLLSGVLPTVAAALTLALSGSGVFLGLLFVATAASALKLIGRSNPLRGIILPSIGIIGIMFAIIVEIADPAHASLRISAFGGILLGIPFAAWRGRRVLLARRERYAERMA